MPAQQVRFAHVFRRKVAWLFVDNLLFSDHFDSSPARTRHRLQNVQMLVSFQIAVVVPPLEVFRENVGFRRDVERLSVRALEFGDVAPHVVLPADAPAAGKVVQFLAFNRAFHVLHFHLAGPL